MKEETVIVYWALMTAPDKQTSMNLMWEPPTLLNKILPRGSKNKETNYRVCSGAHDMWKNTYAIIHPTSSSVEVSGPLENPTASMTHPYWLGQPSAFDDSYRVDYDFSWIFFSEESVKIQQLPAILHDTSDSHNAILASGSFDISKWFRAVNLSYILRKGKNTITVTEGEPATYLQFLTDKKVILQQFEMNEELRQITREVVFHKIYFPNETLDNMYKRFIRSNRHKRVLKLIKQGIL
jgi:hypothetical protein